MLVTFKSCPLKYSHRDLFLRSIHNNLPQKLSYPFGNLLFLLFSPFCRPAEFSVLFFLSESIRGVLILPVLALDSA